MTNSKKANPMKTILVIALIAGAGYGIYKLGQNQLWW
jgi:hypothetical protein